MVPNENEFKSPEFYKEWDSAAKRKDIELPAGFLMYYSGGAEFSPTAFGIELGVIDEACSYIKINELMKSPTTEQVLEYFTLKDNLPWDMAEVITDLGPPSVFLLWHTS